MFTLFNPKKGRRLGDEAQTSKFVKYKHSLFLSFFLSLSLSHLLWCPWVTPGNPPMTQGDPWVTQDDPWVTQDDPWMTLDDPRMTQG